MTNEHYPPGTFDGSRDAAPRIVALVREIDRLRREVEFEAHGVGWTEIEYAILGPPICACVTDEQAIRLGPGFSRPVCAVHPGSDSQKQSDLVSEKNPASTSGTPGAEGGEPA
jgi:hypothetical protein